MHGVLRGLSIAYAIAATAFATTAVLDARPDLKEELRQSAADMIRTGRETATRIWNSGIHFDGAPARQTAAKEQTVPSPIIPPASPIQDEPFVVPVQTSQNNNRSAAPPNEASSTQTALARLQPPPLQPPALQPGTNLPPAAEAARVEQRLRDSLSSELLENFGLFLYVSKADQGPWAQHMYVFAKEDGDRLTLLRMWPVSTGREIPERNAAGVLLPTYTPAGLYQLDPGRFYQRYRSTQWGASMPYAMFFNWIESGSLTGIAIHAAIAENVAQLGQRSSAGCVRLGPNEARELYRLIRSHYRGTVPRFAQDRQTRTMNTSGILARNRRGEIVRTKGYRVLVVIENYGGGEETVAALF